MTQKKTDKAIAAVTKNMEELWTRIVNSDKYLDNQIIVMRRPETNYPWVQEHRTHLYREDEQQP